MNCNEKPKYRAGDIVRCVQEHGDLIKGAKYEVTCDSGGMFVGVRKAGEKGVTKPTIHPADVFEICKKRMDTIVISTDRTNTTARLMIGGNCQKTVKLKRYEKDKHNLKQLVAYAAQKLLANDGHVLLYVREGYTGSVAVINSRDKGVAQDGKILEFTGGNCYNWSGFDFNRFMTIDELKAYATAKLGFDVVELHRR